MPKVKLEVPFLMDLPQPPPVVDEALHHWRQYLRFLPWPGPRRVAAPAQGDREHLNLTRALQQEMQAGTPNPRKIAELRAALADLERRESIEPDESKMYDWRLGERMEDYIVGLPHLKKQAIWGTQFHYRSVEAMLRDYEQWPEDEREERFTRELRSAYLSLAGKLCPNK